MKYLKKPLVGLSQEAHSCEHATWTCNRCGTLLTLKGMTRAEVSKQIKDLTKIIKEAQVIRDTMEDA